MKRRVFIGVFTFLAAVCLFFGGYRAGAAGTGAGSASDPLITKSYLESRLEGLSGGQTGYAKVTVKKGETLKVSEGTEFFMYTGGGQVEGSLVNLASGDVFSTGNIMVRNNLFCSLSAGSGAKLSADAVFYIKGSYTIE